MKPYKEYGKFKEILNRVNEAAINRKSIEIVCYTMSRKKETRRRVDPHRISLFFTTRKAFELLSQGLDQEVEMQPIRLSLFVC